ALEVRHHDVGPPVAVEVGDDVSGVETRSGNGVNEIQPDVEWRRRMFELGMIFPRPARRSQSVEPDCRRCVVNVPWIPRTGVTEVLGRTYVAAIRSGAGEVG